MSLGRYCRPIVTATLDDRVVDAARALRDRHVGCLVVTRESRPVGILTDRDVALRVVAEGRDPSHTTVGDVATLDPIVVRDVEGVEAAASRMREHGIRRLPVVDDRGILRGLVTLDDIVCLVGHELADLSEGLASCADATDSR
jgi:CBS domain-containing protein